MLSVFINQLYEFNGKFFCGQEWLPSAAKHVMLYKAFGWEVNFEYSGNVHDGFHMGFDDLMLRVTCLFMVNLSVFVKASPS